MSLLAGRKYKIALSIIGLAIEEDSIRAEISDGRSISIPLAWFEKLANASKGQLEDYELSPAGYGIHWPQLDEDVSIRAFIEGIS